MLPRHPDDGEQSPAALRGSRIHAYIAARLRGWPLPAIGKTKVDHIQLGKLRRYLGHGDLRCEAAYSFDGYQSTFLGENLGRDYGKPGTLCGAADIVIFGKRHRVVDVKTGSYPVPPPAENWQLATLAALVYEAHGLLEVTGAIATLARDGSWTFDEHTWKASELARIRDRLVGMLKTWRESAELHAAGWDATPTPGQHCKFCKCVCEHGEKREEQAA